MKSCFNTLVLSGLLVAPLAFAQGFDFTQDDESEGFVFTDEDVSAADAAETDRALQAMIHDGALFLSKNREAYSTIVEKSRNYSQMAKELKEDRFEEAASFTSPADQIQSIVGELTGQLRFSVSSGQFLEGPLSRSTLEKARRNLTSAQFKEIEKNITRSELLAKFWTSPQLMKIAQTYNEDWLEYLQQVARFKSYMDSFGRNVDDDLNKLGKYVSKGNILGLTRLSYGDEWSEKEYTNAWLKYFGTSASLSSDKVDKFLSRVLFDDSGAYSGPQLKSAWLPNSEFPRLYIYFTVKNSRAAFATHFPAAELRNYMNHFDGLDSHTLPAIKDAAREEMDAALELDSNEALMSLRETKGDTTATDAVFRKLVQEDIISMIANFHTAGEFMVKAIESIESKTHYIENCDKYYDLLEMVDAQVMKARERVQKLHEMHLKLSKSRR